MTIQKEANSAVFEQPATLESWDNDYYHPLAEQYYDEAIVTMLKLMEVKVGATVLDAGCGPGVHSVRVAREGHRVCAIDISQTMLDEAKSRVSRSGLASQVEFRQEDLTKLSFPDASFGYVFSWGVIIHIRSVERALDELCRIVQPGGRLALYVTNNSSWDGRLEALARIVLRKREMGREEHKLGSGIWYEMHGEKLWVWRFNIPELISQLEDRGMHFRHRVIGEFSEIQRRVRGPFRKALLRLNNRLYRLKFPPGPAVANLLVFEK